MGLIDEIERQRAFIDTLDADTKRRMEAVAIVLIDPDGFIAQRHEAARERLRATRIASRIAGYSELAKVKSDGDEVP